MYSHTLEQECSPHSCPGLSSAQCLKSASTLSPALPGAVAVEVWGCGHDGVGEESCERRKRTSYIRVLLCIHCIFPGCSCGRVNLLFPVPHGRCWGEELCLCEQSSVCELFSWCKTLPLTLEQAGCFCPADSALPRWSPQHRDSFSSISQGTASAGTRAATLGPEGRIPAQHQHPRLGLGGGAETVQVGPLGLHGVCCQRQEGM